MQPTVLDIQGLHICFKLDEWIAVKQKYREKPALAKTVFFPYHCILFYPDLRKKYYIIETNFPSKISL